MLMPFTQVDEPAAEQPQSEPVNDDVKQDTPNTQQESVDVPETPTTDEVWKNGWSDNCLCYRYLNMCES